MVDKFSELQNIASNISSARKTCFIVMPIDRNHILESCYHEVIKPIIEKEFKLKCVRIDEEIVKGKLTDKIFEELRNANLVIVETTEDRANCYFEAGYAVACGKSVIWLRSKQLSPAPIPFDVSDFQFIFYTTFDDLRSRLRPAVRAHADR